MDLPQIPFSSAVAFVSNIHFTKSRDMLGILQYVAVLPTAVPLAADNFNCLCSFDSQLWQLSPNTWFFPIHFRNCKHHLCSPCIYRTTRSTRSSPGILYLRFSIWQAFVLWSSADDAPFMFVNRYRFLPWRLRQKIPPKRYWLSIRVHGVTSQKTVFVFSAWSLKTFQLKSRLACTMMIILVMVIAISLRDLLVSNNVEGYC